MSYSAIGPDGKVYCKHMQEAAKRTSYTSKHPNRDFYCCKRVRADPTRCNFWSWADDLPKQGMIHASGSSPTLPPQSSKEGAGTKTQLASISRPQHLLQEHTPAAVHPSVVTPQSKRRLENIEAGLKQREQDLSPARRADPSSEPGLFTSSPNAQVITQPPSPALTEIDCEMEARPPRTYSFLGLSHSPESVVSAVKDGGQPSTPKKQRLVPSIEGTVVEPATDPVSPGCGSLFTPPQTTLRITQSGEPEPVSIISHGRKGKEREGRLPGQLQDQDDCGRHDPSETGGSDEPQENSLPLFALPEDISTVSSASPTTAENALDYTDGMKARVKVLSEYMDSFDITQAVKTLQTVERQKNQYEFRDRDQGLRITELVAERDELAAEIARLQEALLRCEESNRVKDAEIALLKGH